MSRREAQEVIAALSARKLRAVCPHEQCDFDLSRAALFYMEDFPPKAKEVYQEWKQALAERAAQLKAMPDAASEQSGRGSRSVNMGFMLERLVPCLEGFPCGHQDCRLLGEPVDYLSFNGITSNGRVESLSFIEVKSGAARLSPAQKLIKDAVARGRVEFDVYASRSEA
jgi:predicted Holliday junction resolvase-like endonuclease